MAKDYIVRKSTNTIFVKESATEELKKELVNTYGTLGWTIKPCQSKKKVVIAHEITKEFNIEFDKVQKDDMLKYLVEFVKDEEKIKAFAKNAHMTTKGEPSITKKGKPKYNHLAAKRYFFKTYFPSKWAEIEKVLESRKFKTKTKAAAVLDLTQYL